MKKTKKLSFAAVMCAVGCVIMYLGSIIDVLDMSTAALASFLIVICMIELGGVIPFAVYIGTSVISFFVMPNKSVALVYTLFFGFYPILKRYLERTPRYICLILKFLCFNTLTVIWYLLIKFIFTENLDMVKIPVAILLNVIFFTFDLAITMFVTMYVGKLRKRLRLDKFFK